MKPCTPPSDAPSRSFTHYVALARRLASSGSAAWSLFYLRSSQYGLSAAALTLTVNSLSFFSPSPVPPRAAQGRGWAAAKGGLWTHNFILSPVAGERRKQVSWPMQRDQEELTK